MEVTIKRINANAKIPTYATDGSAGFDIYSTEDVFIRPNQTVTVGTGIEVEVPEGHVLLLFPRSGVSAKTPLIQKNCVGVIDSDYRGEVKVLLQNTADKTGKLLPNYYLTDGTLLEDWKAGYNEINTVRVDIGDRIAQGIIIPIERTIFVEGNPTKTKRGKGGLGSTGQ